MQMAASDQLPPVPATLAPVVLTSPGVKPFGILVIASSFMSYVPGVNLGTLAFIGVLVCTMMYLIATVRPVITNGRTLAMLAFLFFALVSVFNLLGNGWGVAEWVRGVAPFTFFLLAVFLPPLTAFDRKWLSDALFVAGLFWLARILITAIVLQLTGQDVFGQRLTYHVVDAVLPYPLVMVPYLFFCDSGLKQLYRWLLVLVMFYVYIWIGYRAGMALMSVPILVYFLERIRHFNLLAIIALVVGVIAFYYFGVFGSFQLTNRFEQLSSDANGARLMEWTYAFESFKDSPIFGKGIGWQVPGSVTYYGLEQNEGSDVASVGYVHSSIAYMAMTMGLIGLGLYFYVVAPRVYLRKLLDGEWFAFLSLLLIVVFCFTQASYRTIQVVLMLILLVRLNTPAPDVAEEPVGQG
ncbi:O-antigen ligase family protein [Croceibacterium aestuarii]|uniref:O-antigen ligase family protein n=1 Tax=Croceibacterium aestuarii TaxID=3064139 RepID=UPI00272E5AFA|nr:O-antigen ligase family protein [Croceibacterium sp. D39]